MKFGIAFLVLLVSIVALHLSAIVSKNAWFTSFVFLFTYMVIAGSFAGLAQPTQRPFWIAYVSATSLFILLLVTRNAALNILVNTLLIYAQQLLPAADGGTNYFPLVNLQSSLETILPPTLGFLTGCMASLYCHLFIVRKSDPTT